MAQYHRLSLVECEELSRMLAAGSSLRQELSAGAVSLCDGVGR